MDTVIRKGEKEARFIDILLKMKQRKGIDTRKYCGVISLREDPLVIQKKMRDEWE